MTKITQEYALLARYDESHHPDGDKILGKIIGRKYSDFSDLNFGERKLGWKFNKLDKLVEAYTRLSNHFAKYKWINEIEFGGRKGNIK